MLERNILLRIIRRIGKEPWKETPLDTISTKHNDAENICINKVVVEKVGPDCVDQIALQKCEYITISRSAIYLFVDILN